MVEAVVGPLDLSCDPLVEGDEGTGRLEVEEVLRVDVAEPPRLAALGEERGGERRALRAVVPAAERGDENRAAQAREPLDAEVLGDQLSLRECLRAPCSRQATVRVTRPPRRPHAPTACAHAATARAPDSARAPRGSEGPLP